MHLDECYEEGSAFSVVKCIASEFIKTKTIFYIPDEAYAGYTYLFEEGSSQPQQGWAAGNIRQQQQQQQQQRSPNPGAHHMYAFVQAKEISDLHQHQHHHHNRNIMMHNICRHGKMSSFANVTNSTNLPDDMSYHLLHL
jgi:hypothetical protein